MKRALRQRDGAKNKLCPVDMLAELGQHMVLGRFAVPLLWVHCIWSVVRDLCITYARKGLRNVIRSADSEAS